MSSYSWIFVVAGIHLFLTTSWAVFLIRWRIRTNRTPVLGFVPLLSIATVGGIFTLLLMILLMATNIMPFGVIHFLWLVGGLNIPTLSLLLVLCSLFMKQKERILSGIGWVLCVGGIAIGPVAFWMSMIEPFRLQVERVTIPLAQTNGNEPVQIGVLADIQTDHVTDYEQSAVERLMQENPDIVLLPGDLFQGSIQEFERESGAMTSLMMQCSSAPGGSFAVEGNVDIYLPLKTFFASTPVLFLHNEVARTTVHGQTIAIAGIEFHYFTEAAQETVRELCEEHRDADVRILMSHSPEAIRLYGKLDAIDLIVSGHTHGGQVAIPGFGAVLNVCENLDRKYASGGLFNLGSPWLYVSRGVGYERDHAPRIRAFCPPEVSLLTIR